jgi:hypothetical protein
VLGVPICLHDSLLCLKNVSFLIKLAENISKKIEKYEENVYYASEMKIKKDFGQRWRWDRKTFRKTTLFRVWARFVENFVEKRLFLRVTTQFFENFFGKRPFLHVTTYFFEKKTTKNHFCVWQRVFLKTFLKKDHFPVYEHGVVEKVLKKDHFCVYDNVFYLKKNHFCVWLQLGARGTKWNGGMRDG